VEQITDKSIDQKSVVTFYNTYKECFSSPKALRKMAKTIQNKGQVWWLMATHSILRRQRSGELRFEASPGEKISETQFQ
jgi:hypothetical protein